MKNKDVIALERAEILNRMNQAIAENNAEAFNEAFLDLCQKIEEGVIEKAEGMTANQDAAILAERGVRQLTSREREYYEKVIDAMRSPDPKQALNNIETVFPETIIDAVFEDLRGNHPLLGKLQAYTVTGLTRMMMNTDGEQMAAWGKLTGKIIEELTSGFKEVDVTQDKLSAFLPISKPMLDLGPSWLDAYIREILYEALANGLEYGIVCGNGKDMPIGMIKQVGEGTTIGAGGNPDKEPIKVTAFDMEQLGNIAAIMARGENGKSRTVQNLIILVNPVDYWRRILPATRMMTPDGVYVSSLPIPADIIQSFAVPEGRAIFGMASKYFLGVGMAKNGKIEYSDEYRFLEDERVYLIKTYAYGFAKDNNAFQLLDITDLRPLRFTVVTDTVEPTYNAELADLRVGGLTLEPAFDASTTEGYTVTTSNATNTIVAVPASGTAEIVIKVKEKLVTNGAAVKWEEGANAVTVDVTDGTETKQYQLTVTKE